MNILKIFFLFTLTFLFLPFRLILAAGGRADLNGVSMFINSTIAALVPIIIGFALVSFLWGILVYLWKGDDETQRKESKSFMLWGIIGLFVMVSLWGLVSIFANTLNFHLPNGLSPTLPSKE